MQGVEGFKVIKSVNGVKYENVFYYIKDVLGYIRNILDKHNQLVVSYYYNAWGEVFPQFHETSLMIEVTIKV